MKIWDGAVSMGKRGTHGSYIGRALHDPSPPIGSLRKPKRLTK